MVNKYHSSFCRRGGGGGETAAAALRRQWRLRATTRVRATEVGFPPDFFPSTNRFLRFPSNLQNGCMKIVLGFFFCYLLKFLFQLLVHGCAAIL